MVCVCYTLMNNMTDDKHNVVENSIHEDDIRATSIKHF